MCTHLTSCISANHAHRTHARTNTLLLTILSNYGLREIISSSHSSFSFLLCSRFSGLSVFFNSFTLILFLSSVCLFLDKTYFLSCISVERADTVSIVSDRALGCGIESMSSLCRLSHSGRWGQKIRRPNLAFTGPD